MEHQDEMVNNQVEITGWQKVKNVVGKINNVIDIILTVFFRLRKLFMAAPVVYYAIKLAKYNMENLPAVVGVNLQANGAFAQTITREMAVMGPLGVTAACLLMMFLTRKTMVPWAISIFSLALPILVFISNRYPA